MDVTSLFREVTMNTKKFACTLASISIILLNILPLTAQAASGMITFSGAIVNESCQVNNSNENINVKCYSDGKIQSTTAPINASNINFTEGQVKNIKWINDEHTLGIMNVVYR